MIHTRRGLAIAAAIVVMLGVAVMLDRRGETATGDRALLPGFDPALVSGLAWPARAPISDVTIAGVPRVELRRDAAIWRWTDPAGEAEPRAVDDVLAALRGARWHRRGNGEARGPQLVVTTAIGATTIIAGDSLGADQQWLAIGDRTVLVDAWVVRALFPEPLALRVRAPLAAAGQAQSISISPELRLTGSPRRRLERDHDLVLAPDVVGELERALVNLVVVELPRTPLPLAAMTISLDDALAVSDAGPCPGNSARHAIVGVRTGPGCVEEPAWQAMLAATERLRGPPESIVERRLVSAPLDVVRVTLADGSVLALDKRPRIADSDADPARVVELLTVLATPATTLEVPRVATPTASLTIATRSATVKIALYGGRLAGRYSEPLAARFDAAAYAILVRGARAYRDPTLWTEEPTTIHTLAIGGTTFTRGAVIGEWAGGDAAMLDRLATLLASLRGRGETPPAGAPIAIELAIVPPVGPATTHRLAVGTTTAGCAATVAGTTVLVDPEICTLLRR
ncbi:MAG: hypothetical protein ABI867_37700 [Kofleriaceae bacterium]